jgi:hypothetical protein
VRARTAGLNRVNCVVRKLNPFACLAFPIPTSAKMPLDDRVLVTTFLRIVVMPWDRDWTSRPHLSGKGSTFPGAKPVQRFLLARKHCGGYPSVLGNTYGKSV